MNRIATAIALSVTSASLASAADLPARVYTKAPALVAPVAYNWTGFYAGINGGYGSGDVSTSNTSTTTNGDLFGTPGAFTPPSTFVGSNRDYDLNGGFGGGQIGYNWQAPGSSLVWGLEADFQGADISGTDAFTTGGVSYSTKTKVDWFGTVRGRLGYALGTFLPYVTGGLAYAHTNSDLTVDFAGPFVSSNSKTSVGYAIGGGIEAAVGRNWTVRAEYLHMNFGKEGYDFTFSAAPSSIVHADAELDLDIVRAGLNYRF